MFITQCFAFLFQKNIYFFILYFAEYPKKHYFRSIKHAEVAQLIERQPSKLRVEGLSPFFRSKRKAITRFSSRFFVFQRVLCKPRCKPENRDECYY